MKPLILALLVLATPVTAQQFTSAAEVKPILEMQKAQWIVLQEIDGKDWVYFTPMLSWRCALETLDYGLNGAEPDTRFEMEPCHEGTPRPNVMDPVAYPIYVTRPLGSVQEVRVKLTYDDGSVSEATFPRHSVLMP